MRRALLLSFMTAMASVFFGCSIDRTLTLATAGVQPYVSQPGSPAPSWQVFTVDSNQGSNVIGIVTGPDGNLWIGDSPGSIARVTPSGSVTLFPLPNPFSYPLSLCRGPSDTIWFTENGTGYIGKITMSGQITEYTANPLPSSRTDFITRGKDGNFWFSETNVNYPNGVIGRIRPSGRFLSYLVSPSAVAGPGITTGPDGNVWFVELNAGKIGKVTPQGQFTEFGGTGSEVEEIAPGPDGNLWFTVADGHVGKSTVDGSITVYSIPGSNLGLGPITDGPDKHLWVGAVDANELIRIDTAGNFNIFAIPFSGMPQPYGITTGPDRNVWFTVNGYRVGVYIRLRMTVTPSSLTFSSIGQMQTISVKETHYHGSWTATSDPSVVSVSQSGSDTFTVTAVGTGSTTIDILDSDHNDFTVPVVVQ